MELVLVEKPSKAQVSHPNHLWTYFFFKKNEEKNLHKISYSGMRSAIFNFVRTPFLIIFVTIATRTICQNIAHPEPKEKIKRKYQNKIRHGHKQTLQVL